MRIVPEHKSLVKLGEKFSRLTVTGAPFFVADFDQDRTRWHKRQAVVCLCECGSFTVVTVNQLRRNKTKSCGCWRRDLCIKNDRQRSGEKSPVFVHGASSGGVASRLYRIWAGMRNRCNNSNPKHHRYSGRGINVCAEWDDFRVFESWAIANGYSPDLTIERNDNDGNYEPGNCRWATPFEQAQNRSTTKRPKAVKD